MNKTIGNLFWYSIGDRLIDRELLKAFFEEARIDYSWLPNPVKISGAFRRATRNIEKKKINKDIKGVRKNFIVREVASTPLIIQRNLILEIVDKNTQNVDYKEASGVMKLNRRKGKIKFRSNDNAHIEKAFKKVNQDFDIYKNNYSPETIRALIPNILSSTPSIPMRKNGGIYFIPESYSKKINKLVRFINLLEKSEGYSVSVSNSLDHIDMVVNRLSDYFNYLLERAHNANNLRKYQIIDLIKEIESLITNYKELDLSQYFGHI